MLNQRLKAGLMVGLFVALGAGGAALQPDVREASPMALQAVVRLDAAAHWLDDAGRDFSGGDYGGALTKLRQCIVENVHYAPCYRALGIAYAKAGNWHGAARAWRSYVREAPRAGDVEEVERLVRSYSGYLGRHHRTWRAPPSDRAQRSLLRCDQAMLV